MRLLAPESVAEADADEDDLDEYSDAGEGWFELVINLISLALLLALMTAVARYGVVVPAH